MANTTPENLKATFKERVSRPFEPLQVRLGGKDPPTDERIAHALEYIAAQLGEINRKIDAFVEEGEDEPPQQQMESPPENPAG